MPDWSYHPVWRPIMFRLPAEDARRLTLRLLSLQGKTRFGRALFNLLSAGLPPAGDGVDLVGIKFASRFGLGPGIDVEGSALSVLQYLGFGFMTVGPVTWNEVARIRALDRQRMPGTHAIAWSENGYSPDYSRIESNLRSQVVSARVPVGVEVSSAEAPALMRRLSEYACFFSVQAPHDATFLRELRAATARPLFLRVALDEAGEAPLSLASAALEIGFDGLVVGTSEPYPGLPRGHWLSDSSHHKMLEVLLKFRERFGSHLPIIASGGVLTPEQGLECITAGADLAEITTGLIYSGPGICRRSTALLRRHYAVPSRSCVLAFYPRVRASMSLMPCLWLISQALIALALAAVSRQQLEAVTWHSHLLLSSASTKDPIVTGASTAASCCIGYASVVLTGRGFKWAMWLFAVGVGLALLVSPALSGLGLLILVILEARNGWLRSGFPDAFHVRTGLWIWSGVNLGRRLLQVGATVIIGGILARSFGFAETLLVIGAELSGVLLLERGLEVGVRPLWFAIAGWATSSIWVLYATMSWPSDVAALVASSIVVSVGLAWLFGPLIVLDEGLQRFPDV